MSYIGGKGMSWWTGQVVNTSANTQGGEVQIRIHGLQDDKSAIPDTALRWARCAHPVTSAQLHGSGSTHRLMPGGTVIGIFLDDDEQHPIILHTLGASGDSPESNSTAVPIASKKTS